MSKQARVRTQELRKAQEEAAARQTRRRRIATGVGVLVILGLIAAIVLAVVKATGGDDKPPAAASGKVVDPANSSSSGSIPVGQTNASVAVEIYYDYMCSACGAFEAANSGELDRLLEDGTIRIELHPISFLDRLSSGTEYSTRAANAFATVADAAPDSAWDFHQALYAHQPAEGSKGLSDDEIASIAKDAGVPGDVIDRFADRTYEAWVGSVTQKAFDAGVTGTPTIKINGELFTGDAYSVGPLTQAIESAAGEK